MPPSPRSPQRRQPDTIVVRNRCASQRIKPRFQSLIDDVVTAYIGIFTERIVDIRLQGSVARGEAAAGRSDIDFMALLAEAPSGEALARLQDRATMLGRDHPVVSRVELDIAVVGELSEFQRFVLASDSLSLYGTDLLTRRTQRVERAALARLVTPDVAGMVRDYREWVEELIALPDDDALRFASRIIGKDLLKGLRLLVLLQGGPYEVTIERMRDQAAELPAFAALATRLGTLYQTPTTDAQAMLRVLEEADLALLPAIHAALRIVDARAEIPDA